jgi:hypothetical protein
MSTNAIRTQPTPPTQPPPPPGPLGPTSPGAVTVRILVWQPDLRHTAHAGIATAIGAYLRPLPIAQAISVTVVRCRNRADVIAALAHSADIVVVTCHSTWQDGTLTALLGTDLQDLTGLIRAHAVILDSCWLATTPAQATALTAHPTPVAACSTETRFKNSPLLIGPLLADLAARAPTSDWRTALNQALAHAHATAMQQLATIGITAAQQRHAIDEWDAWEVLP